MRRSKPGAIEGDDTRSAEFATVGVPPGGALAGGGCLRTDLWRLG